MSSFLDLPAELRNQVYGYIAIPHTAPLSSYIGLYLSSRQIRSEMDSECAKIFRAYLKTFQDRHQDAHLVIPESFAEMQHVRLHVLPTSNSNLDRRLDKVTAIFLLHLASLSIIYSFPEDLQLWHEEDHGVLWLADDIWDQLKTRVVNSQRVRTVSFWASEEDAKGFVDYYPHDEFVLANWTFLWDVGLDGTLHGVWKKADGKGRSEVPAIDTMA
ncbi:uncharacterized protein J4E88_004740 [Alternaria novae-zelandiae]|uniref:uncharacterized protein n=1 Tax=Alternaria ethzedia TaxID=181014 RepID=UPI0020C3D628|nr:uncharacterized protein J4E87_000136 [Alternaria ethzedia]XP_049255945.1 uncharacterized protein J4E88_004740 [Alternaria novae-zelandiae]KAI4635186.1 hypothetical protein J4E87_000136 [Alternaria ethzedia]KAI4683564.1 hypothetical protein J4E88_004740 [Alternaria novae-zelandiae]